MERLQITPRDVERRFLIEELFFSITDRNGVITYGNEVFARVSGHPVNRLLGALHSIIRHPDMPRCVFKLLWDTILAGKPIAAYVKNMAADGCHYWVVAIVTPINDGFLSIRLKPSGELFKAIPGVYAKMLQAEQSVEGSGGTRREAMEQSTQLLVETLKSLGYSSYDGLMHDILISEIGARRRAVGESRRAKAPGKSAGTQGSAELASSCDALGGEIARLFGGIDDVLKVQQALGEQAQQMRLLAWDLMRLSLNAQVRSAGLPDAAGRTLQVVAEQMSRSTRAIAHACEDIQEYFTHVQGVLKHAAALIATSDVSIEMMLSFLAELSAQGEAAGSRQRIGQLAEVLDFTLWATTELTSAAAGHVGSVEKKLGDFIRELRTLEILHITGKVEAVQCMSDGSQVSAVFAEVHDKTKQSREKLGAFVELVQRVRISPPKTEAMKRSLETLRAAA